MKKILCMLAFALIAAFMVAGCGGGGGGGTVIEPNPSFTVLPSSLTISPGTSTILEAKNADGTTNTKVAWTVDSPSHGSFDGNVYTAPNSDTTVTFTDAIIATSTTHPSVKVYVTVTVDPNSPPPPPPFPDN